MTYDIKTNDFELEYIESIIQNSVLWENHCHAQYELIAVLEGDISIIIEGKSYLLTEGRNIIVPPLCYHSIRVNESRIYRRITVLFDLSAVPEALRSEFVKKGSDVLIFSSPTVEKLGDICQRKKPLFYAPLAESLMVQLFYDTLMESESNSGSETDEFLQRVVFYIDEHLHEKILLDDLARYTSRSKSSFCHLFEKKLNVSPKQYILQKKLALASKLIADGTPPTVAAMQIGYENYSNFYRLYLKQFGISPTKKSKYRET